MNELKKRFEEILNLYITIEKRQSTVFTSDSTSSSEPLGQQVLDQYIVAGIPLAVEALTTEMKKKPDKYLILLEFAHWYYDKYKDGTLIADVEEYLDTLEKTVDDLNTKIEEVRGKI